MYGGYGGGMYGRSMYGGYGGGMYGGYGGYGGGMYGGGMYGGMMGPGMGSSYAESMFRMTQMLEMNSIQLQIQILYMSSLAAGGLDVDDLRISNGSIEPLRLFVYSQKYLYDPLWIMLYNFASKFLVFAFLRRGVFIHIEGQTKPDV